MADSLSGEGRVAVAFSGGLDSSILARCASSRAEVVACTAFTPSAGDANRARWAAATLRIDFAPVELTEEEVAGTLSEMDLPFKPTLMDRSLWCLYSVVSKRASESGAKAMLLGQLADELFGGYSKYAEALRTEGEGAARSMMASGLREYELRGRVRDTEACRQWVQPKFPYGDRGLVEYATSLPVSFKIREGVRKAVLRRAAVELGVPEEIAWAPKKAAQYSSGIQKLVASSPF